MSFIDSDAATTTLEFSQQLPRINAVAAVLRERVPQGSVVGLIGRTGPDLVFNWLGAVVAGLKPLIVQYPTRKQSRQYWQDSVTNTVELVDMKALIVDDATADACPAGVLVLSQSQLDAAAKDIPEDATPFELIDYSILQLSSGTTGYRKAIEFEGWALDRHVKDYNVSLGLSGDKDVIVSWLPLYHDMGYVACFVMAMILGVPVVMMDPMTWVEKPARLYDAITAHKGTIAYMPNFGFELMSMQDAPDLSTMRWWISCSEPVSPATCRKFAAAAGVDETTIAPCYAMAENIYAATIRRGVKTLQIDDVEVISCGAPIEGVEMKTASDGEIWLKSPTSLKSYIGMDDITDADGFYPTGDLGEIRDGEVYVTGRKQDLVIQAGRKFMLSDVDLVLNRLFPDVRGRGVACAQYDERLGTTAVLVLVEDPLFFRRTDGDTVAAAVRSETGIEQLNVVFVPPRFLTKTSSGKFNRKKSVADYALHLKKAAADAPANDFVGDMKASFGAADWAKPVGASLDSLSLTMLRVILSEANIAFNADRSLDDFAKEITDAKSAGNGAAVDEAIHIVTLADRNLSRVLQPDDLKILEEATGRRVTVEHLCLPPSPVILSDLVFHDYFQPRIDGPQFRAVDRAMATLRKASLILVDDIGEISIPIKQTYAVLSHSLERDQRADRVLVRWQRYPQYHDQLPATVVSGGDLPLDARSNSLTLLSDYLGIPIFRIATLPGFSRYTKDWELVDFSQPAGATGGNKVMSGAELVQKIVDWSKTLEKPLAPSSKHQASAVAADDLGHFCSHFASATALAPVIDKYDRFCVVGQSASAPYVRKAIEAAGKSYVEASSYAPEVIERIEEPFDVVLACGAQGKGDVPYPFVAVMSTVQKMVTRNITDPKIQAVRAFTEPLEESGKDWYCPSGMRAPTREETEIIIAGRQTMAEASQNLHAERLKAIAARSKDPERQARAREAMKAHEERLALQARLRELRARRASGRQTPT